MSDAEPPSGDSDALPGAEADLVARLRSTGRGSKEWCYFHETLLQQGIGALFAMHRDARLFGELRKRGIVLPAPPDDWRENAPGLIHLAVRSSIDRFMEKALLNGGWDPKGGASCRTYFVNICLYSFAGFYKKYYCERGLPELPQANFCDDFHDSRTGHGRTMVHGRNIADPESLAVDTDTLQYLSRYLTPTQATIVLLTAVGLTQEEIGKELGISAAAVSSSLRRLRDKITRDDSE